MSSVDVTVVIPCFRAARTIERALRSVAAQTSAPREIIVVDDASGDDTVAAIRRVAAALPVVLRLIEMPTNHGVSAARNAAWDAATQEYIAFLDADDSWHPRKLEIHVAFMSLHTEYSLSGHAHGQLGGEVAEQALPAEGFAEVTFAQLLWSNRFTTSSAMIRRRLPQRFPDGQRHMEDHRLWLGVASAGGRIARLDGVLSYRYAQPFGEAGLSAHLLRMECAELGNFAQLRRERRIGLGLLAALWSWSLMKFARRLSLVAARCVAHSMRLRRSAS